MPKVSIIVPSYNHGPFLRQRMESVIRQTFRDFELILLDDCSPDESRSILSEYRRDPRVRTEFNAHNSGNTFKQWNKGLRLAQGEYVWIAESDDYADEKLLERLVSVLDCDANIVLCNTRSWCVDADGQLLGKLDDHLAYLDPRRWTEDFTANGREECGRYLLFANTVQSASSVVFRREAYWKVGGADETLRYCGDWKMWASMALLGGQIAHVGETLNFYRTHGTTVTAKANEGSLKPAESLRVIRWILERAAPDEFTYERLCREIAYIWVPAVLSGRTPLATRKAIFKDAMAIDRHALRKFVRPAMNTLRLASSRRYQAWRAGSGHKAMESARQ